MIDVSPITPREQAGLVLAPRAAVTGLRFRGSDEPALPLPSAQRRFTIGAEGSDLIIPRTRSTAVSAVHAVIERVGDETIGASLLVRDLGSANGTFATRGAPRAASFHVHGGDTFWIADVALQATDPYLDALRTHLACHLGLARTAAIDDAVAVVATDRPLLLLGPRGTGARRLASVIHATSVHRDRPLVMGGLPLLGLLGHAQGATVFVDLDRIDALPARVAAALFDPARGLHLIFAAADETRARARLDHYRDEAASIALVPLAARPADVVPLLSFLWSTELETSHSVEALGPSALRALVAHPWPNNLDELVEQAPRLLACLMHSTLRGAAASLGVTRQTLGQHLDRLGVAMVPARDRG